MLLFLNIKKRFVNQGQWFPDAFLEGELLRMAAEKAMTMSEKPGGVVQIF